MKPMVKSQVSELIATTADELAVKLLDGWDPVALVSEKKNWITCKVDSGYIKVKVTVYFIPASSQTEEEPDY